MKHFLLLPILIFTLILQGCANDTALPSTEPHEDYLKPPEQPKQASWTDKAAIAVKQSADYLTSQVRDPSFAGYAAFNMAQGNTLQQSLRKSHWLIDAAMSRPQLAAAAAAGLYGLKGWADNRVGAIATDDEGRYKDDSVRTFQGRVDDVHGSLRALTHLYSMAQAVPVTPAVQPYPFGLDVKRNS